MRRKLWTLTLVILFVGLALWAVSDTNPDVNANLTLFNDDVRLGIGPSVGPEARVVNGPPMDGLAQTQNASIYLSGDDGSCSAGVFKTTQAVFVLSAGHCAQPQMAVVGPDIVVEPVYGPGGDDISIWEAVSEEGRSWLADRATGFPMGSDTLLDEGTEIHCLAHRAIGQGRVIMPIVSSGETGGSLNIFKFDPSMRNWTSLTTFDGPSWPGSSGAVCYGAENQPVAMIVGGLGVPVAAPSTGGFGVTVIPQPPTFLEGPEAFNAIRDYLLE